jgi:hypothetical protein
MLVYQRVPTKICCFTFYSSSTSLKWPLNIQPVAMISPSEDPQTAKGAAMPSPGQAPYRFDRSTNIFWGIWTTNMRDKTSRMEKSMNLNDVYNSMQSIIIYIYMLYIYNVIYIYLMRRQPGDRIQQKFRAIKAASWVLWIEHGVQQTGILEVAKWVKLSLDISTICDSLPSGNLSVENRVHF